MWPHLCWVMACGGIQSSKITTVGSPGGRGSPRSDNSALPNIALGRNGSAFPVISQSASSDAVSGGSESQGLPQDSLRFLGIGDPGESK